jgi:hypothetical protein
MEPAIFSPAGRRTTAAYQSGAPRRDLTIRQLRRRLRYVRLSIARRYRTLHEYARIYHALAAREVKGSERESILLYLAAQADVRVERVEMSLRRFRISNSIPTETWVRRFIRWSLLRWRVSWTLALLDRVESRRSRRMLDALTQLSRLCRVINAGRTQPKQFSTRLSFCPPDEP